MKRVLFVLGGHLPKPSANGACVMQIQRALQTMGIASDVVCEGASYQEIPYLDGTVYTLPLYASKRSGALIGTLRKAGRAMLWPVKYPGAVKAYRAKIRALDQEKNYDLIIGVAYPVTAALACSKEENFALYELDPIANNLEVHQGVKRLMRHRSVQLEKALCRRARFVLHLRCDEAFYSRGEFDAFRDKFVWTDIPMLTPDRAVPAAPAEKGRAVTFLYAGNLMRSFRSPAPLIALLDEYAKTAPVRCDVYSRGDCEQMLAEAAQRGAICPHGFVDAETLSRALAETDVLVSIGNKASGQSTPVPSKIFEYMSYGMPILHFYAGKNDLVPSYLARYPLGLVIDPADDAAENAEKLRAFVADAVGRRVDFDTLKTLFPENTPEHTASLIAERIGGTE